ncbi:hypothetical protein KEJ49_01715 [Candidatus Bathyarchaeota archaeon]|nr:hypothetical protein [Candidatus Bathyarchaeota archaeon]
MKLAEELEERFFDILLRTINYAIEFSEERSYASLRFMDLFSSLLDLQPIILRETRRDEFYGRLREKLKSREVMESGEERSRFQREILEMFIDEWRRSLPKGP